MIIALHTRHFRPNVRSVSRLLVSASILLALLLASRSLRGDNLSFVAESPDWEEIEDSQETLTRAEFVRLLDDVYAPNGAALGWIQVFEDHASVLRSAGVAERVKVRFARSEETVRKAERYWRTRAELGPSAAERPLSGMRIALDPGHIGGDWSRMEGRWFKVGDTKPVMEGSLSLLTAEHLAREIHELGAEVLWVRRAEAPTTEKRPSDFFPLARTVLASQGIISPRTTYSAFEDNWRGETLQFQAELLFFRMSEIRSRSGIVNSQLKPDLTLCVHFNAEAWGPEISPQFAPGNHFHILVNGCYSGGELRFDDQRHDLLVRLLGGVAKEEQRISAHLSRVFALRTALPPFVYRGESARNVGGNPYVWARNLLANRLYRCPVVFLEPYVMNSQETWERVQAGDYEGERLVAGSVRRSLYREYAKAVAEGLASAMR